jgi:FMN phosphatase YigB (HAD superfamily)
VLVRFDHDVTLRRIQAATGVASDALRPHLFGPLEAEYDLGRVTTAAFFRAAERAAGIPRLDDEVWIPAWRDIFTPVPAALSALSRLEHDVVPVLVSNTNALHWEGVLRAAPELPRLLPLRALSFELGAAKPDPAHFRAALDLAEARPEDALYADDRPALVEAARKLGIDGFVVTNPDLLASELRDRGLLEGPSAPVHAQPARFRGTASPHFVSGLAEFRAGRFFEAHEEWELLWKESNGEDKVFLQALIQLAAACVHIGRGNAAPGRRLLALAKAKLDRFADDEGGMNVGFLKKRIEAALALSAADLLRQNLRDQFRI